MLPDVLPPTAAALTEATSIEQASHIQRLDIATPLRDRPVPTTYVKRGTGGTPILLLHGFDSSVLEFRRLQPLLASHRETWAVDLLGFGFTERGEDLSFSPSDIEAHLYGFWQAAIAKPVVLVGASMGGAAAIDFALTYPEAVEKLVLLDSAGIGTGPVVGKYLFPPLDYFAAEFLRRPGVRNNISYTAYFDKQFNSEDARCCAALHLECDRWNRALISFTKSGGYPSFKSQLPDLDVPTLILWGEDDKILGTKDAPEFYRLIPNRKLIWIPCCGHVPHLERPNTTARRILEFVEFNN
ncbi:alpha/beta fold hydrolase [Baaleninema simplex]|uniref:alpha/beta fold hydrolase n=1 Tax=Baaleninema simplex TaxID=2862350 RepID=UPI00034C5326|nr:alpha/beta hydrolase [Baaleninema simplex]